MAAIYKPPAPQNGDEDEYKNMSSDEIEDEGLAVHVESSDNALDSEALMGYRATLKTIDTDIAKAESQGMTGKVSQLKNTKEWIQEELRKNTNIKGESRKAPDTSERARKAVLSAIKTALKNISNEIPELSHHLHSHISKGHTYKYTPKENLDWQV